MDYLYILTVTGLKNVCTLAAWECQIEKSI